MNIRFSLAALFLILPLPCTAGPYIHLRDNVQEGLLKEKIDDNVSQFVRQAINEQSSIPEGGYVDVLKAIEKDRSMCGKDPLTTQCDIFMKTVESVARDESRIRSLGYDFQAIATGYEFPIDGYPGRPLSLPIHYTAIINLWRAGTSLEKETDASRVIRMIPLPDPDSDLGEQLKDILKEKVSPFIGSPFVDVAWRYQYGVRFIRGEIGPPLEDRVEFSGVENGGGTERQNLFRRWIKRNSNDTNPDTEDALLNLYEFFLNNLSVEPPIEIGEAIFLPPINPEEYDAPGLPNGFIWVYFERTKDDEIIGDVGLQFHIPIEPRFPATQAYFKEGDDAENIYPDGSVEDCEDMEDPEDEYYNPHCPLIPGGHYPPNPLKENEDEDETPIDGLGLCMLPLSKHGYLCASIQGRDGGRCLEDDEESEEEENEIQLTRCVSDEAQKDLCIPDEFVQDTPEIDSDMEKGPCDNCFVDLYCGSEKGKALTEEKDENGRINIKLPTSVSGKAAYIKYLIIHENVHAKQQCDIPPFADFSNIEDCCRNEQEAYITQCEAMAKDGILEELGGNISPSLCGKILSNLSCAYLVGGEDGACFDPPSGTTSTQFGQRTIDTVNAVAEDEERAKALDLPETCEDAVNKYNKSRPTSRAETSSTEAGPDVCRDILTTGSYIIDTPQKDEGMKMAPCANCLIDMFCKSECVDGSAGTATAGPKTEDGRVEICLPNSGDDTGMHKYLLIHELVHGAQMCPLPPGETLITEKDKCCKWEYEAYDIQCKALKKDGILSQISYTAENAQGERGEYSLTAEFCADILSNVSCKGFGDDACFESPEGITGQEIADLLYDKVRELWSDPDTRKELGLPDTCEDAIKNISPQADSIRHESVRSRVCAPECKAQYINTIGNNVCYIGMCLEETLESHRIIGGRSPFNISGEAFPWDPAANPEVNVGGFLTPPPLPATAFRPYRPHTLYRKLDEELCQAAGLPPLTPPTECLSHAIRRLSIPLQNPLALGMSLGMEQKESKKVQEKLLLINPGIGPRMGTEQYLSYLKSSLESFRNIVEIAADIFSGMRQTEFPSLMCPLGFPPP